MKVDQEQLKVEYDSDLSSTFFIQGDYVYSLCVVSETRLLVPLYQSKQVLLLDEWVLTNQVSTIEELELSNHLLLPGFDWDHFPFMIVYSKDTYDLKNIKTGVTSKLIKGSADSVSHWPSTFFVNHRNGKFDFHFATSSVNDENKYEHTWHYMPLNSDFK